MTAGEEAVYLRARKLWLEAGAARRADPFLSPSFGATVVTIQSGAARLVWLVREFWRALWPL